MADNKLQRVNPKTRKNMNRPAKKAVCNVSVEIMNGKGTSLRTDLQSISIYFLTKIARYFGVFIFLLQRFFRSSLSEVFCKKGVLRNFAKFTGKHLCQGLFFNKVATLIRKRF